MAAPKGNQYYQLVRMTMGRPRAFKTPEDFLEAFAEYVKWCEDNPILSKKASKRTVDAPSDDDEDAKREELRLDSESKRRPMSLRGMCVYFGRSLGWFENTVKALQEKEKRTKADEDFLSAFIYARNFVAEQQYDGAVIGDFNATIVMRSLGIGDKIDVTSNGEAVKAAMPVINIIRDGRKAGALDKDEE